MENKIKKTMLKLIAMLLCTALLMTGIGASAISEATPDNATPSDASIETPLDDSSEKDTDAERKEASIIGEIDDKREESVKHFMLDDRSSVAVQYAFPVHFKEADSEEWVDYDNTLEPATLTKEEAKREDSRSIEASIRDMKQAKTSDNTVRLANETKEDGMISFSRNGYDVSWGYEGAEKKNLEIKENNEKLTGNDRFTTLTKVTSEAWYYDVYENVDLQTIINPTGIKENFVLKNEKAQNEFIINYDVSNLKAHQANEKTIELVNSEKEVIYTISAPYMEDAKGETRTDLKLEIVEQNGSELIVRLITDREWIDEDGREFPIIIDPYFEVNNYNYSITSVYVDSDYPSSPTTSYNPLYPNNLYVGRWSSTLERTLIKINTLPPLTAGDRITNAQLVLGRTAFSANNIKVHKINTQWTTSVTWNNTNNTNTKFYDNIIQDYKITSTKDKNPDFDSWDITNLTKGWYEGTVDNNGIILIEPNAEANSSSAAKATYLTSSNYNGTWEWPSFYIFYRNQSGLEDYWSFHQQSVNGGNGFVNDYNGNLVFTVSIAETSGLRMPAEISLAYNGNKSDSVYEKGLTCGNGWMMNLSQRLVYIPPSSNPLVKDNRFVYTDADGTNHYFLYNNSLDALKDEDGLGLTLTLDTSGVTPPLYNYATITTKDGTEMVFYGTSTSVSTTTSLLHSIEDIYGNKITFNYSTGTNRLTSITDGAGRSLTVNNTSITISGITYYRVTSIVSPDGTTTFNYVSGTNKLSDLIYPDGTSINFTYNDLADGSKTYYRIENVTGRDGLKIKYVYPTSGNAFNKLRVASVTEYQSNGTTAGNKIEFDYSNINSTTVKYHIFASNGAYALTKIYNFDTYGRVTSVVGADESIGSAEYTETTDTFNTLGKNNKTEEVGGSEPYVNNLLKNHSFENGIGGYTIFGNASSETNAANVYIGDKSLKLTPNGAFRIDYNNPTAQTQYTVSAYVKADNIIGSTGARILIELHTATGNTAQYSTAIYNTNGGWERLSHTFTTPSGVTMIRMHLENWNNTSGAAYFDAVQLEKSNTMNAYNMLENSSFDTTGSWTLSAIGSNDGITPNGTMKITGDSNSNRRVYQTVQINKTNPGFFLQAKAKADSVPPGKAQFYFMISLDFYYSDGSTDYKLIEFNNYVNSWQSTGGIAMPPSKNKVVSYVRVYLLYDENQNTAYFDDVMLIMDGTGTVYTYDNNGNATGDESNLERSNKYKYNKNDQIIQYKNALNEAYENSYNKQGGYIKTSDKDPNGKGSQYVYGASGSVNQGNITSTKCGTITGGITLPMLVPSNPTEIYNRFVDTNQSYIETSNTYTSNGAYVKTSTNQRGKTTTYDYDPITGLNTGKLVKSTDPEGNFTFYDYYNQNTDGHEQLKSITGNGGNGKITYGYDALNLGTGRRLTSIKNQTGQEYKFGYDNWGNNSTVSVGASIQEQLVENTYYGLNGPLYTIEYKNTNSSSTNQKIKYNYDKYGRITSVQAGTGKGSSMPTESSYVYNAKGQLTRTTDNKNGNFVNDYMYDQAGRLTNRISSNSGGVQTGSIGYNYDQLSRLTSYKTSFGGRDYNSVYNYAAGGRLGTSIFNNSVTVSRTYDSLGRETQHNIIASGSTTTLRRQTTAYENVSGNRTTTVPVSYSNIKVSGGASLGYLSRFTYEYDNNGNIITIVDLTKAAGSNRIEYYYDVLNQLTRENNQITDKTTKYVYDGAGNITTKTEYSVCTLGTATPGGTATTINYTYSNNWTDRLASYNGGAITYDGIGNPTTYYNGRTFIWQNGRQLKSSAAVQFTQSFEYDVNGFRTKKTNTRMGVSSTTEYFVDDNGTILAMKQGEDLLTFMYDSNGTREGFRHQNGSTFAIYYYVYNAQGDVIGIAESTTAMNVAVTYSYDVWGKPISTTGNQTLITLNPFRYRGYVWDSETSLYYLNSRYYDPNTGRFINADGQINEGILGTNMFVYCNNNPVNCFDPDGTHPLDIDTGCTDPWCGKVYDNGRGRFVCSPGCAYYLGLYFSPERRRFMWSRSGFKKVQAGEGILLRQELDAIGYYTGYSDEQILRMQRERSWKNVKNLRIIVDRNCFTEDTLILTKEGYKKIKDITEDDYVYAENTETGERGFKKVTQTFKNETETLVYITINGDVIESTEGHPFYILDADSNREFVWFEENGEIVDASQNWIYAGNLRKGDIVKLADGTTAEIESVEIKQLDKPIKTYNFEVEDWNTYFVGENSVLVHNISKAESTVWQGLFPVKGQSYRTDGNNYYAWDYTHGHIEVYNKRGVHTGVIDAINGTYYGGAVAGRTLW